jgi:hypothetical protein
MVLKEVYYGRYLKRIPLSSYPAGTISTRGVGGVIKPRHFYIPTKLKIPKVNTVLNAPDLTEQQTSHFASQKESEEKSKLTVPTSASTPNFKPMRISEVELETLEKKGKKRKPQQTKASDSVARQKIPKKEEQRKHKTKSSHFTHRVNVV